MRLVVRGRDDVAWWDSPAEIALATPRGHDPRGEVAWAGETWGEAVKRSRLGWDELVPAAEALVSRLSREVVAPDRVRERAVAGAWPHMPSALAGIPDCMVRLSTDTTSRSPIRVAYDTTSSGGISTEDLRRRGTAALALVMALSADRPVELVAVSALCKPPSGACVNAVRVGTTPMDLAMACYATCGVGLARLIGYGACHERGSSGAWPWNMDPLSGGARYAKKMLGLLAEDGVRTLYVPPVYVSDPLLADPVGFIERALREYSCSLEE